MKKILSIISAGLLVVLAASCNKDEKATFDPSDVTAPVLGTVNVGTDVVVNYTPAVFSMDFNKDMPTYHTLGMIAVNDEKCDVTLSNAKDSGTSLKLSGKNMTAALQLRGFAIGEQVKVTVVVRASIQDPSKGVTNGYVDSEESYTFDWTLAEESQGGSLPKHDGVRIYINNQTGWDAISLYMWGDVNDFGGGWPGVAVTGTISLGGIDWTYFDYSNEIFGLAENLIFNNNGGGTQLADYPITFEEGVVDYWLTVTAEGVEAAEAPAVGGNARPSLEGFGFFVDATESTLYNEAIALYAWGDGLSDATDLFGGWPGMQPTGTAELDGVTYFYFDLGAKTEGKVVNFIINNNGGGSQLENFDVLKGQTIDHDFFFKITDDTVETVEVTFGGGGSSLPDIDLSGFAEISACAGAEVWSVIGNAVGGWEEANDVNMEKVSDDPEIWTVSGLELPADKFKFRGNHTWADWDLGGGTWAVGTPIALTKGGGDMMAEAGTYTFWLYPTYGVLYIEAE